LSAPLCQGQGGPHVVALGGGHGLAVTLSAVSRYAGRVTAIVSAADDGGSSGRLRADWPGPAPGDVRRCLLELAGARPAERAWAKALDFRFPGGDVAGHSLGNLVLVGLSETMGDFVAATAEVGRLLGVTATVLPAASVGVDLCAEIEGVDGPRELVGQVKVAHTPAPIRRVWLDPGNPAAPHQALEAIAGADQVVLGPGSLFTSVLAVCAVPAILEALNKRQGGRVYVCNLATQDSETTGFDADAHLSALVAHHVTVDTVVCDPSTEVGAPPAPPASPAPPATPATLASPARPATAVPDARGATVVTAAVASPNGHSHDPGLLSEVLSALVAATATATTAATATAVTTTTAPT
jgi:uncharacterized cofD-like protein